MRNIMELPDPILQENLEGEEKTNSIMHYLGNDLNVIITSSGLIDTYQHRLDDGSCPNSDVLHEKILKHEKSVEKHKKQVLEKIDKYLTEDSQETDVIDRNKVTIIRNMLTKSVTFEDYRELIKYYEDNIVQKYKQHEHHKDNKQQ